MFRKCRNIAVCLGLMLSASVLAQQTEGDAVFSEKGYMPYAELPNQSNPVTKGLGRRVLFFVDFNCPFCRGSHRAIEDWASTLPREIEFEIVPVVGTKEHIPAALAYYTVLNIDPMRAKQFQAELYSILQDSGRSTERRETFIDAASRVGIAADEFIEGTQSEATKAYTERAFELTKAYGLQEVPTLIVANRFITAPQRVQHQMEQFLTVMNGLVSIVYTDIERERMR